MEPINMTINEAAAFLRTDRGKVQQGVEKGEIPAYREGKNWKIPRTLLQKYAEDRATAEAEERRSNG